MDKVAIEVSGQATTATAAEFDIETPSGSATAEDAAARTTFKPDGGQFSKDVDTLATISLDTPKASDADTAFLAQNISEGGQLAAAATSDVLPAAAGSSQGLPAAVASGVPLSSTLSSFRGSERLSEAPELIASTSSSAGLAPAAAPASTPISPAVPELPKAHPVKVWVKDPEKVSGKLLASHISCLVRTECSQDCPLAAGAAAPGTSASSTADSEITAAAAGEAAGGQQQQQQTPEGVQVFEVRRRFDDFELLSRLLKAHYRGYFIPRLPPSEWLTGGDSYIRTRKTDLQDYLNLVVSHPALQGSAELRLFLTAAGDLSTCTPWQRMVQRPAPMDALLGIRKADASSDSAAGDPAATGSSSSTAAGSASAGGGWGMMARMRHSIMNVVQQKQQQPELSAEEQQLRQAKDWLKELQQHLSSCVAVVRSLVGHMESLCEDYGDLGRALSILARFEEAMAARQGQYTPAGSTAVQRGADLQKLGYGALRQHSLSKQSVVSLGASLVFLPDYFAFIPECVGTLQEREDALDAVHILLEQLREKQEAATKTAAALGPAAQGDKRMVAMNASIHALQDKLLAAEQHYKLLLARNQSELLRLNLQRADDFRRALGRFAALQAQAAAAAAEVWGGVAEQFAQ